MGRRFFPAVLILGLAASAPAEQPADAAVRYFRWLALQPNELKKTDDDTTQRFSRLLFAHASEPQVADFLDESLERLSADPVCERCHLSPAAYASGRPDLKIRALRLLRQDAGGGRFAALFDQLSGLLASGQGSLPAESAAVFGTMLAEAKLDESLWRAKIDAALRQSHDETARAMVEAFVREAKGDETLKRWQEEALRMNLAESMRRLRRVIADRTRAQVLYRVDEQDILNVVRQPSKGEVVRFLDEVLLFLPWNKTSSQYDPLYAAAYASGDARLQARVVELLRRLIEGTDRRLLQARLEAEPFARHGHFEMRGHRSIEDQDYWMYSQQMPDLKERSGRALYIFRSIFNGASRQSEFPKQAAVDLILKLDIDYALIARDLEYHAGLPEDSPSRWIAAQVIKRLRSAQYWEMISSSHSAKQLEWALQVARQLSNFEYPDPDRPQPLPTLFLHSSRPEVTQLVREKLGSKRVPFPGRHHDHTLPGFALVGYASGDSELKRESLAAMRKEIFAPSENLAPPSSEEAGRRLAAVFQSALRHAWALRDPSERERYAAALVDLFADLGFDYTLFGRGIEANLIIPRFTQGQRADPALLAVEALILRLKGKDYWDAVRAERTHSGDELQLKNISTYRAQVMSQGAENLKKSPSGAGPVRVENQVLAQFAWELFSRTYEPEVVSALASMLVDAARAMGSSAVERWRYRPVVLAAYASGDARLKDEARALIEKLILDAQGSEGVGRRYRTYLEEIAAAVAIAPEKKKQKALFSLAVDFLASLKIPYEAIEGELEFIAHRKGDSPEKKIALELIKRRRGGEYAAGVAKRGRLPKAGTNVYINGGYSPTTNFPSNEDNLLSFYRGLFKSDALILNAGGEPGQFSAAVSSSSSSLAPFVPKEHRLEVEDSYRSGTYENIKAAFDMLAQRNPEELTVVFGGHGNQRGVSLWHTSKLEALSWTELNGVYQSISPETRIKSIFLQCYGGATVLPLARRVPKRIDALEKFASYYYPANRCALALSSEDELSTYYENWDSFFNRYQDLSLRSFQERLYDDEGLHTSPVLTSDYFLGDVGAALCAAVKSPSGRSEFLKLDARALEEIETGCAELGADPVHQARARQLEQTNRYQLELQKLLVRWAREIFDEKFSKTLAWWKEVQPGADELYAYHVKSGQETDYTPAQLQDLMRILALPSLDATTAEGVFSHSKMLRDEYNKRFNEFIRLPGNMEKYKDYNLDAYLKEALEGVALSAIRLEEYGKNKSLSSQRRVQERAFHEKQRAIVESWISRLASLRPVRARYESIKNCEARPLNNER